MNQEMIRCSYKILNKQCEYKSKNKDEMLSHIFYKHSTDYPFNIRCLFCDKNFKNYNNFKNHVEKKHSIDESCNEIMICNLCEFECDNIRDVYSHYYKHIKLNCQNNSKTILNCLYSNCDYKICQYNEDTYNNFKSHLSRRHRLDVDKDKLIFKIKNKRNVSINNDNYDNTHETYMEDIDYQDYYEQYNEKDFSKCRANSYKDMAIYYNMLYLKLKDKQLIAKYKCDDIFESINKIVYENNKYLIDIIEQCKSDQMKSDNILEIIENYINKNMTLFEQVHKCNKYDSDKRRFLKDLDILNIAEQINLTNKDSYQYISVKKSIETLFKHEQIADIYFESNKNVSTDGKIRSYRDARCFKENELFKNEPNAIQFVFYNDSYSSNNPLGDRRGKQKINATYFKIGNFPMSYQALDYFTQAAILIEDDILKIYGYDRILTKLVEEMIDIETNGIDIKYKDKIYNLKGTISFFTADNLASNGISGFVESFQSNLSKNSNTNLKIIYCKY